MPELVKALLAKGADPNVRIQQPPYRLRTQTRPLISVPGATPLLLAAASVDAATLRVLVESRAKPLVGTEIDKAEFERTGYSDDSEFQGSATPILVAAGLGRNRERSKRDEERALGILKSLVEMGADVNAANEVGWTPMHAAAFTGADSIIQFLSDQGARVNVRNGCGQTPLSLAEGASSLGLRVKLRPRPTTSGLLKKLGAVSNPDSGPAGHCIPGRVPALADLFGQ
jgi:ankyrin repeat protein